MGEFREEKFSTALLLCIDEDDETCHYFVNCSLFSPIVMEKKDRRSIENRKN